MRVPGHCEACLARHRGCARSNYCAACLWQWPLVECVIRRVHWDTVPLVGVARLLLQDFWTVLAKGDSALIDPIGNPIPIVRQGTLV